MKVLILCGGRGTRLNGERPKPLLEIAGRPIVGARDLDLRAAGIQRLRAAHGLPGRSGRRVPAAGTPWQIECVDTGLDTPTGGRAAPGPVRLASRFCLTYADGVADIDLS